MQHPGQSVIGWLRLRGQEALLAVVLMTRLPMPRLPDWPPTLGKSAWAFPLAGLVLGLLTAAVLKLALVAGLPAPLAAGLALGAQVVMTGALHEDGLADCADGFWGGFTRERRLEIMRDSRIGTYGVTALVLSLGLRWQALAFLADAAPGLAVAALIALAMSSRVTSVALMATLPAARDNGMGHRATGVTPVVLTGAMALGMAGPWLLELPLFALVLAEALAALVVAQLALRKLGGQTGDVLGAAQQCAEIAGWCALCALLI
ncbi:adenosylcobinamide-GDP ribazoletransferase [Rhodobacter sp. TJ_12]|uniref:adenosylcobinamide-GDP ribazoletransferase n=1 Tax=Rhodobacter sp. TJ_12 TaxID=2029399 RepID=UPI001CBF263D|nr:adenosylcobinamide-GDP ribazoletransferase [Rhodobacter sp. TJ_12]MBZ4021644.1 adenosylcobinamide-GDP ribazoletransferase [Rhodobacter sp. TJ_12]